MSAACLGIHLFPAAAAILPSNGRRIVRALEVIEMSGRPFGATLKAFTLSRDAMAVGDTVAIRLPAERLHLFDAQSGQRVSA